MPGDRKNKGVDICELPQSLHHLIDMNWIDTKGAKPMRYIPCEHFDKEAAAKLREIIRDAREDGMEFNLACTTFGPSIYLLKHWPAMKPMRLLTHPEDSLKKGNAYRRLVPDDEEYNLTNYHPTVIWVDGVWGGVSEWWVYQNVVELNIELKGG